MNIIITDDKGTKFKSFHLSKDDCRNCDPKFNARYPLDPSGRTDLHEKDKQIKDSNRKKDIVLEAINDAIYCEADKVEPWDIANAYYLDKFGYQ